MLSKDKGVTGFFRGAFLFVEIYFRKCRATYKLYLKRAFHKGVAKRLVGCPFSITWVRLRMGTSEAERKLL